MTTLLAFYCRGFKSLIDYSYVNFSIHTLIGELLYGDEMMINYCALWDPLRSCRPRQRHSALTCPALVSNVAPLHNSINVLAGGMLFNTAIRKSGRSIASVSENMQWRWR